MKKKSRKKEIPSDLREKAGKKLNPSTIPLEKLSEAEIRTLAHELQIHQIELEMQAEELHKSQTLLEESRQKYFTLYDLAPVGYFTLNEKGFILEANLAGASLLGTERHSLLKKPLSRYIAREEGDLFYLHLARVSESGNKGTCELKMLKGNQPFYVHLESIAVKNTEGNIIQYLTTITDISERVEWEEKLKNMSHFPGANPHPVLRVSGEGRILYANNASSHLLNLWGCRVGQILPESLLKMIADTSHNNSAITYESKFGPCVYSLTFAPVVKESYINIYGLDLTQRKRMEKELLQAQKLKAMGVMTSGVAHEFNNILAIIDGKIQMLMRGNKDKEKLPEELYLIRKSIRDGVEIVRRMNKFTKVIDDRMGYVTIDLREVIKDTINLTLPKRKERAKTGISYTINSENAECVSCIKGNPLELREIFINIINNAIDAMPDGGTLSFSTREEGGNVSVNISDTGIGMDEETQAKLFDPFFTTKDQGTGLGMSIVFGIVKRHGGKIEVQSQKGKGSTFILSFPSTKEFPDIAQSAPKPGRGTSEEKNRAYRILIIDNEEVIGKTLSGFLDGEGYKVVFINNGAEALERIKKEKFDLVLCDLGMPDVSGWDIMNAISTMARKPVIGIITGYLSASEAFPDRKMKADFVINKPFELEDVLRHIQDSLKK